LLRLLARHPGAQVAAITSRGEAGTAVADLFPHLRGRVDLRFRDPDPGILAECDLVFFATPNGTAMKMVPELLARGAKVIDLAADFRLKDPAEWERWYGMPHACPDLLQAVYGCQVNRTSSLGVVASPGCYRRRPPRPLPLLEAKVIDHVADCRFNLGCGAGRRPVGILMAEVRRASYAVAGHRHSRRFGRILRPQLEARCG
jgi:N-acetyl-gamma-glutamyl-phosphate reductase